MKGVLCYELFGGIALENHAFFVYYFVQFCVYFMFFSTVFYVVHNPMCLFYAVQFCVHFM